jgi:hypothetical protein
MREPTFIDPEKRRSRKLPETGIGSFQLQCRGGSQGCVKFPQPRESPENPIDLRVLDGSEVVGHDYRVHQQTRPLRVFAIDPHNHPARVSRTGHVARDRRHDGLGQARA